MRLLIAMMSLVFVGCTVFDAASSQLLDELVPDDTTPPRGTCVDDCKLSDLVAGSVTGEDPDVPPITEEEEVFAKSASQELTLYGGWRGSCVLAEEGFSTRMQIVVLQNGDAYMSNSSYIGASCETLVARSLSKMQVTLGAEPYPVAGGGTSTPMDLAVLWEKNTQFNPDGSVSDEEVVPFCSSEGCSIMKTVISIIDETMFFAMPEDMFSAEREDRLVTGPEGVGLVKTE